MRLLLDANLSPRLVAPLTAAGYEVIPMLVALRRTSSPSVVHLRNVAELGPDAHSRLLITNLPTIAEDLERGVIVSLSPTRLAIRNLPVR